MADHRSMTLPGELSALFEDANAGTDRVLHVPLPAGQLVCRILTSKATRTVGKGPRTG
jgi:hypothetical protein